jgi:hypothetical protein
MLEEIRFVRDYLREEGRVIRQAPIAFMAGCLLVAAVIFGVVGWHYSGSLELAHDTIENQKTRIEQLQEELKGVSPQLAAIQARRVASRQQLLDSYVAAGSLLNREMPYEPNTSMPDRVAIAKLTEEARKWVKDTADKIENNFGVAAREKFLDISNMPTYTWGTDQEYSRTRLIPLSQVGQYVV